MCSGPTALKETPELAGQGTGGAWGVSVVHKNQNMEWKAMSFHKELRVYMDGFLGMGVFRVSNLLLLERNFCCSFHA